MGFQHQPYQPPLWRQLRDARATPDQILTHFGQLQPPVPVHDLAAGMGIFVHRVHQPGWDGAVQASEARADIWLDAGVAPTRERFTLAHEIGHLINDPLGVLYRDLAMASYSPMETQANAFAAALLMPSWMVATYFRPGRFGLALLANRFMVSMQAAQIRAEQLGLVSR